MSNHIRAGLCYVLKHITCLEASASAISGKRKHITHRQLTAEEKGNRRLLTVEEIENVDS